jgi:hypothetical protein
MRAKQSACAAIFASALYVSGGSYPSFVFFMFRKSNLELNSGRYFGFIPRECALMTSMLLFCTVCCIGYLFAEQIRRSFIASRVSVSLVAALPIIIALGVIYSLEEGRLFDVFSQPLSLLLIFAIPIAVLFGGLVASNWPG